jgi:hypothetical protein
MVAPIPATVTVLLAAVERLLTERGPMTPEQLLVALGDAGVDLGDHPEETLGDLLDADELPLVLPLLDGRHASVPGVLAGRVFTHRLSAAESKYGLVAVTPDLEPLSALAEDERHGHLPDGTRLLTAFPDLDADLFAERGIPIVAFQDEDEALLLPPDHFRVLGLSAGDLVGFRVTAAGISLSGVAEGDVEDVAASRDVGARLTAVLAQYGDDDALTLDMVIWTACGQDADLFRTPLPPLGDLLAAAGLPHEDGQVGPPGFDFNRWQATRRIESIQRLHDLGDDEALAVFVILNLYRQVAEVYDAAAAADRSGADRDATQNTVVQATLRFLADPDVAEAVLVEAVGAGRDGAGALGVFAETLEPLAPRSARPALRWLRAKALERFGDVLNAEAAFDAAQGLDPTWPLPLLDLARYASDRGDAERGLALLRRAGAVPDDSLVELLEHFRPHPRSDLGRNQPCWCGSGRKYKQCHLNRERLPLAERAAWLYQKAGVYLADGPWRAAVVEVAAVRAEHWEEPDAILTALQDPLVTDAVLFEGEAFAAFLAERGVLLPEDERLLAEQWLLVERSVYEVESVRAGAGFTVRDLLTGDRHDVRERAASRQLTPGMLVCARFVPAGDTTQCFGGIEVISLAERDLLIALLDEAPDPVDLVAALSRRFAPPELRNTEGDPLAMCSATLQVADPAALLAALDAEYERQDDEPENSPAAGPQWLETVITHGMVRIRATLRLEHDRLHVETNSEARLDRVLATLQAMSPELTLIEEQRQPAAEIREALSRSRLPSPSSDSALNVLDPDDPGVAAVLDQVARQYEQAWLDDSIPALAGQTPRQAAADPTRRPDLIRLLDSFPPGDQPGQMNPDRLRSALELE